MEDKLTPAEWQEVIEAIMEAINNPPCVLTDDDCDKTDDHRYCEAVAVLSLKWPDGTPMFYVGAKASPDLYASVTEAMNTAWTDEDRYMSLIRQGFRKVVIDGR